MHEHIWYMYKYKYDRITANFKHTVTLTTIKFSLISDLGIFVLPAISNLEFYVFREFVCYDLKFNIFNINLRLSAV